MRSDPVLRRLIRNVGPCGLRAGGAPHRFLVRAILRPESAARASEARLHASFGGALPVPAVLAAARSDRLRRAGLLRQRAAALQSVARAPSGTGALRAGSPRSRTSP
jgi:3-methyladenine DNA glycosylase/8-oxoguanine DNA glycosylase